MKRAAAFLLALTAVPAGAVEVEILSRVSPGFASETAMGESLPWALSADGRFLVFSSNALNLVAGAVDGNNGSSPPPASPPPSPAARPTSPPETSTALEGRSRTPLPRTCPESRKGNSR